MTAASSRGIPRRSPDLEERLFGSELVILDGGRATVVCLNAVAAAIWEMCDGRHTAAQIAAELAEAFGIATSRVDRDVRRVLDQLSVRGFLEGTARGGSR
jgi:hypothetical protein